MFLGNIENDLRKHIRKRGREVVHNMDSTHVRGSVCERRKTHTHTCTQGESISTAPHKDSVTQQRGERRDGGYFCSERVTN